MDDTQKTPPLSNRIRELRERAGLTIADLAARTDLTTQMLSRLERGERPLTDQAMTVIATALRVRKAFLLVDIEPAGGPPLKGDLVEDDYEAVLLRFWRSLSMDARIHIFAEMSAWTKNHLHDTSARAPRAVVD